MINEKQFKAARKKQKIKPRKEELRTLRRNSKKEDVNHHRILYNPQRLKTLFSSHKRNIVD